MSARLDHLDPEIAVFVDDICNGAAQLAAGRMPGWPERRRIAEQLRTRWRAGGPAMARIEEHELASAHGPFRLRLYRPPGAPAAAPVLVYVHGGGWCMFSIDTHDRLMREYAAAACVAVAAIDYCLAPEHPFPAAQDQCVEAVRWLRREAGRLGLDGDRLALGGDSAGANLALTTALRLREAGGLDGVRALLLNYGVFDTRISAEAERSLGTEEDMLSSGEMDAFWHAYLGPRFGDGDPLAVPIHAPLHGLPPAILLYGDRDVLAEQSMAMAVRLRAAGVATALHEYPGAPHSFLEAMSVSAQARDAIARGAQWLSRHLHPSAVEARPCA